MNQHPGVQGECFPENDKAGLGRSKDFDTTMAPSNQALLLVLAVCGAQRTQKGCRVGGPGAARARYVNGDSVEPSADKIDAFAPIVLIIGGRVSVSRHAIQP